MGNIPPENGYTAAAPVNGTSVATPFRGRGRPPKQGSANRWPGHPPKSGGGGSGGRGRGRPKKNATPAPAPAAAPAGGGRPRGRPPKPINVVEGFAPVSGAAVDVTKKRRGRPPKAGSEAKKARNVNAAPPMEQRILSGKPLGRPRKRPRGRPPKLINVVEGFALVSGAGIAAAPVTKKRRGRPPKAGNEAKKARNVNAVPPRKQRILSGKPLGRLRKTDDAQGTVNGTPDSQLLVAYLDLKAKLENLQSMVKQAATLIRPSVTSEAAVNALQELEFVAMNASAPPNAQIQQQPLPEQVQPQS